VLPTNYNIYELMNVEYLILERNTVSNICPLCLEEIGSDHQDWYKHLVGPPACEIHPRKNYLKRH